MPETIVSIDISNCKRRNTAVPLDRCNVACALWHGLAQEHIQRKPTCRRLPAKVHQIPDELTLSYVSVLGTIDASVLPQYKHIPAAHLPAGDPSLAMTC